MKIAVCSVTGSKEMLYPLHLFTQPDGCALIKQLQLLVQKHGRVSDSLLNRQTTHPVIEFIVQGAAPILLEYALITRSIDRSDGLSVGIEPVDNRASRKTQGNPVGTRHKDRIIPAEVEV